MMPNLDRLCVHTVTTKPWEIETAVDRFAAAGVRGITVWRDALAGRSPAQVAARIADSGLTVVSLCRGGFFPAVTAEARRSAIDDNRRAIDEATALGAPLIVLVCGADPAQSLDASRAQIEEGLQAVLPHARAAGVRLAVEPLHPMYADTRSAINSMRSANDICDRINDPLVGVAIDVYHLWWDPDLESQVRRCGAAGRIFAFHVCDWRSPTRDLLNDRGLMGEGCIDIPRIRSWVEQSGFGGFVEVEIFSTTYWAGDQQEFLSAIVDAYQQHV